LIVPGGAVEKETEVTIGPLPEELDAALNEGSVFSTHERRLLAGFSGTPDGLVFAKPIRVRLPVSPLRQGGIPAAASFDLETLATTIEASTISWFGNEGMAEFDVSHFSGGGVLEMFDEEGGLQVVEGSEVSSDDPCREQQFTVVNSAEDRAVSTAAAECQTVSDFLLVVLDACGGQQERHLVSSWDCEIQLEVDQEDTSIPVGHETKLSARVFFTEFPEVEVRLPLTWVNTIPSTADFVPQSDGFIESSGILTGKSPGGAAVGVRTPDPELSLLLGVLITSLTVETPTPDVDVAEGKTRMLDAQARGVDGNIVDCPLLFDSVDPSIATVTKTGVVRGEKRGETEIRVHPTDPKGCPGGCGTIQVTVIRNVEGRWTSPLDVTIELPSDEGQNLMGTCDLTSELAITQNGREACGQFRTTGKCTLMPPDADPIVIDIDETGFLAGLIAEDDTFSYCSQRDDEQEVCLHSSGTFLSDDSVAGSLSCREVDSEAGLLSETHGTFTGQRTSPEVPAGTSCLPISGAAALAACQ